MLAGGLAGCTKTVTNNTVLCADCLKGSPTRPAGAPMAPPTKPFMATIPSTKDKPVIYQWNGSSYVGAEAFLRVVEAESAASVAKVSPDSSRLGSLRMIIPERQARTLGLGASDPTAVEEARATELRFGKIIDQGRVSALQRSGLFEPIRTESGNIAIAETGAADFVLWYDTGSWRVRYGKGDPISVFDSNDLVAWVNAVRSLAGVAKGNGAKPSARYLATHFPGSAGGKPWFTFNGQDHYSLDTLVPAMDAEMLREGRAVPPLAERLGGRTKVVLATQRMAPGSASEKNPEVGEANRAMGRASAMGRAEGLRAAKLFDDIVVETADVSNVPLDGYDYVLWQPATQPHSWRFRAVGAGADARNLVSPPNNPDIKTWVEAVSSQLRQARQP